MQGLDSPIRLVVNADGFGLDAAITRGTLRAHREGIVTSTSVIGNCADPDAIRGELARAPALGVGVHLTLTGGAPIARPSAIRSLWRPDGAFSLRRREKSSCPGPRPSRAATRSSASLMRRWRACATSALPSTTSHA